MKTHILIGVIFMIGKFIRLILFSLWTSFWYRRVTATDYKCCVIIPINILMISNCIGLSSL